MAWRGKVKVRANSSKFKIASFSPGTYEIQVLEEPEEPIKTKFGPKLPLTIKFPNSEERFTWLIPFKETVSQSSLLGQLKLIADLCGGLKGLWLKVEVEEGDGGKRYKLKVLRGH